MFMYKKVRTDQKLPLDLRMVTDADYRSNSSPIFMSYNEHRWFWNK
ncbi:MAG: hypothetical protein RBT59_00375 [Arcobacteraceae bacterium]|nr:hypothetical protein [Arcobacteraceae bacterium]